MQICVTPATGGPAYYCDLFAFIDQREIPPDEIVLLVGDLHGTGQHIMDDLTTIERAST